MPLAILLGGNGKTRNPKKEVAMSALVRYERPALGLSGLLDEFFDDGLFGWGNREIVRTSWPRVDITENENAYRVHADVPGLAKDDIKVTVEDGVLTISGEKKAEKKERKKGEYAYYERSYGSFCRSFNLPDHVDSKNIEAHLKDGVLELTLKKTEEAKPKAIEVNVN
jgi:HSP20 family protein